MINSGMARKHLKGLIKTRHFIERQKERNVSDKDIIRAIRQGKLSLYDCGLSYVLGDLKVTVDHHEEILITVHPGEKPMKLSKLLSREEGRIIKEILTKAVKADEEKTETDDFLKFVRENGVKKLK